MVKKEPDLDPRLRSLMRDNSFEGYMRRQDAKEARRPAVGAFLEYRDRASYSMMDSIQEMDIVQAPRVLRSVFAQTGMLSSTPPS